MRASEPQYLLFSAAFDPQENTPLWRFVLQPVGSDACLAVADAEENAPPSRLELLAVVRGLEALEQPSRVTLLTESRYVIRGIRRGLGQWRERRWRWERFGRLVPIRDADLWRRIDRALQFHQVECCEWRGGGLVAPGSEPNSRLGAAIAQEPDSAAEFVSASPDEEPALVIVARTPRHTVRQRATDWPWGAALDRLRQAVSAQIAAIRGAEFTQAA